MEARIQRQLQVGGGFNHGDTAARTRQQQPTCRNISTLTEYVRVASESSKIWPIDADNSVVAAQSQRSPPCTHVLAVGVDLLGQRDREAPDGVHVPAQLLDALRLAAQVGHELPEVQWVLVRQELAVRRAVIHSSVASTIHDFGGPLKAAHPVSSTGNSAELGQLAVRLTLTPRACTPPAASASAPSAASSRAIVSVLSGLDGDLKSAWTDPIGSNTN